MDPLTLMALVTIASTAIGTKKSSDMASAANAAKNEGMIAGSIQQSELTAKNYKKMRDELTILGGNTASQEGSILSGSQNKKSLLG